VFLGRRCRQRDLVAKARLRQTLTLGYRSIPLIKRSFGTTHAAQSAVSRLRVGPCLMLDRVTDVIDTGCCPAEVIVGGTPIHRARPAALDSTPVPRAVPLAARVPLDAQERR
jgi:hypothetical protein